MENKNLTRWQLRVDKVLENKIRALAEKEHRSINKTVVHILTSYFELLDFHVKIDSDSQINGPA